MSAAAGSQTRQAEISMHSGSPQHSSMTMAISTLNDSIINADYNGAVFMDG